MYSFEFPYKITKVKNEKNRIINHMASYDQWNTKIATENLCSTYLICTLQKGKFPTYHKLTRHTTKSTRYNQLQSNTYYCQVLLSLLRNQQKFAKCHARTNHTSARVSNDTSSPVCVSDDTGDLARVSDDIGGPIRL